jgi:hypothetical protein
MRCLLAKPLTPQALLAAIDGILAAGGRPDVR